VVTTIVSSRVELDVDRKRFNKRFIVVAKRASLTGFREKYDRGHALHSSLFDHLKAIDPRHLDIEEHDVRRGHVKRRKHFGAIATLSGDGKLGKRS
jgi:hypothetical protein